MTFQDRWLFIGSSFVYNMAFLGMNKWPPIGGWLLMRVAAYCRTGSTVGLLYSTDKHVGLMLAHRLQRWTNLNLALGQHLVIAGM